MSAVTSILKSVMPAPLQALGEMLGKVVTEAKPQKGLEGGVGEAIARLRDQRMPALKPPGGTPAPYTLDAKAFASVRTMLPAATESIGTMADAMNKMPIENVPAMTEGMQQLAESQRELAGVAYTQMHQAQTKQSEVSTRLRGYSKIESTMEEAMIAYGQGRPEEAKRILEEAKKDLSPSDNKYVYGHGHVVYRDLLAGLKNGNFMKEFDKHLKNVNDLKINPRQELMELRETIQKMHQMATQHLKMSSMIDQQMRATVR